MVGQIACGSGLDSRRLLQTTLDTLVCVAAGHRYNPGVSWTGADAGLKIKRLGVRISSGAHSYGLRHRICGVWAVSSDEWVARVRGSSALNPISADPDRVTSVESLIAVRGSVLT